MEGYGSLEKWGDPNFDGEQEQQDDEDEEEEETLSLSDLPQFVCNEEDNQNTQTETTPSFGIEEDFDFGSMGGSVLIESEMCAADEVFFQGQLLPLRLSVSSDNGMMPPPKQESQKLSSRSESMERSSSDGLTSLSSRSNSIGSHNSSNTTITTTTTSTYKPKFRNQFHSHPSPKPQISSLPRPGNGNNSHRSRKSNMWGIFKVGLVRTPEIELQELILRKSINSRSSSSSSSRKSINVGLKQEQKRKKERFLFENCKCSVDAVNTIVVTKKSSNKKKKQNINGREEVKEEKEKEKQRKQALYHRRTCDWLKELSIADVPQEEL